ncbi:MAG: AAA family ATPase [Aggregatilineales bacterium]
MLPLRLKMVNFLAYTDETLDFTGMHLACLTGPNGAGKSSILDAITWALWGQARARRDEELIHQGQHDMYVQLDFEQEGIVYRVLRRRTRKQGGTGALDLLAQVNGGWKTLTAATMRETQKHINQLLRLDYDTFVSSAFLQQGRADAFTTKQPRERKQLLSEILGLERWDAYAATARDRQKQISGEIARIQDEIERIDADLLREPALRQALADAEAAYEAARQALEKADSAAKELAETPTNLRNVRARLTESERRTQVLAHDLADAQAALQRQQARVDGYQALMAQQAEIEAGYAALQQARAVDQALADKLRQLSALDERQRKLEREVANARAALVNDIRAEDTRIEELKRTVRQADSQAYSQAQQEVAALRALAAERDALREALSALDEERAKLDETNRGLREKMNELKDRLDRLENAPADAAACPLCGQPLPPERRAALIKDLRRQGTQHGDTFRANNARLQALDAEANSGRKRLKEMERSLKHLQPLEQRIGALESQFAAAVEAESRIADAQARRAALQAALDAEDYAHEARASIAALDVERAAVGYDHASHDSARQQLDAFRAFERRHAELEIAREALPSAQEELEQAGQRQAQAQARLDEAQRERDALAAEIERLTALDVEYRQREAEAERLRAAERRAYDRLRDARQEVKTLDDQRARRAALQGQAEKKRHEEGLYKDLTQAFGRNGVPAMVIETAIPELESAANHLLRRMSSGRMNLRIETQKEKVTGGQMETLDIHIADELGTRPYELFSGGEAFRINFAIRVALSQLLARRAGAHLRTLFLDEGFGTQDAEGRERLVEAITVVQDSFDLILVITHIDELRDSFPVHLVVEKTRGGSRVAVR